MRKFSEVQCPICKGKFRVRRGKPKTLKQWKMPLITHLLAPRKHHLTLEQAESVIAKYFESLEKT